MHLTEKILVAIGLVVFSLGVSAAEPAADLPTLMTERGKLLFSDDFQQPLGSAWRTAKGKWEVVDGAIQGAELKSDMHGAVTRHAMPFQNVVIQYSFKLDGARQTTLSINDEKGHVCRVLINASGFTVQKGDHDHMGPDKALVLESRKTPIKGGEWHTVVVEILGPEMLARIDGREAAFGSNPAVAVSKSNLGLTVAGESASFKDLRVWEALPNKTWESTKSGLVKARADRT